MSSTDKSYVEPAFTSDPETYQASIKGEQPIDAEETGHTEGEEESGPVAMKPPPEEKVEEASWESFPASDPPGWSGGSIT